MDHPQTPPRKRARFASDYEQQELVFPVYQHWNGQRLFAGMVKRGSACSKHFKLIDPGNTYGASYELTEREVVADLSAYEDYEFESPCIDRDSRLMSMMPCGCATCHSGTNCRADRVNPSCDVAFPVRENADGTWHVPLRVGDSVVVITDVRQDGTRYQERFWCTVWAIHTMGIGTLEPRLTLMPQVAEFCRIAPTTWSPKVAFGCGVSRVVCMSRGPRWN